MLKRTMIRVSLEVGLVMGVASAAVGGLRQTPVRRCGPDAVVAGTVCLDTRGERVAGTRSDHDEREPIRSSLGERPTPT